MSENKKRNTSRGSNPAKSISFESLGAKVPPNSPDGEVSVIGSMMLDRKAIAKVVEIINPESFYNLANKTIFEAIWTMFERNENVDILTLTEELRRRGKLEEVGGVFYLSQINARTPTSANVEQYARIVQEKYLKRTLIEVTGSIMAAAYDDTTDALEEIDRAESQIFTLSEKRFKKGSVSMKDLAHSAYDLIHTLKERKKGAVTGIATGYVKLDKDYLGGFQKSDLIIIAGRPSMGKTAFALSMARNMAVDFKQTVAFFSLEMSAIQLVIRLLSAESKIDQQKIRTGMISNDEDSKIVKALSRLSEAPILIDDSAMLTVMELRAKCRRMKAEHDIQAVIVDYLQFMNPPKAESREREISIISQTLKQIAKELDIPVIALAQLNRSVESRPDKRPMLSDLRESGSIEQDADVVMFVNRPEVYKIENYADGTPTHNTAEIIIGKQRNGPIGTVRLAFLNDYARFENLAFEYEEPPANIKSLNDIDEEDPF
ncbi:MAG: replicative DNA helicase [Candidatus Kapaibacterium sp.]